MQLVDERRLMAQQADGDVALRDALRVLRSLLINITFTFLPFNYFLAHGSKLNVIRNSVLPKGSPRQHRRSSYRIQGFQCI